MESVECSVKCGVWSVKSQVLGHIRIGHVFPSFPHRHGDAAGKPATRDKTRGCRKTSISYETSSHFDIL